MIFVGVLYDLTVLGRQMQHTIFILDLCRSQEDSIPHLDFASRPIMRSIDFAVLTELHQDLTGLHRVPPNIVSVANINI